MQVERHFYGARLRLARQLATLSLEELGEAVGSSRQYIHQLETDTKAPSSDMQEALQAALGVTSSFFSRPLAFAVGDSDCHFRRLHTASRTAMGFAMARGTLVEDIARALESRIRLPKVDFPDLGRPASPGDIEAIAQSARFHWGLGADAPISNMTRVLERAGALVVSFPDISEKIDALSMARRRPIVVRSAFKCAAVRVRFDLAHE